MKFYQENIYHVYNRGNNSQKIFFEEENYIYFLNKMRRFLLPHSDIVAWCLMPNHFHWMLKIKGDSESGLTPELNKNIGILLRSYTRAINKKFGKTGSLFQPKTKAKNLNPSDTDGDKYPLICFLYIYQNPFRAGLIENMGEWKFSSFQDYSGKRKGTLCNKRLAQELLELPKEVKHFNKFSHQTIPEEYVDGIF